MIIITREKEENFFFFFIFKFYTLYRKLEFSNCRGNETDTTGRVKVR